VFAPQWSFHCERGVRFAAQSDSSNPSVDEHRKLDAPVVIHSPAPLMVLDA
jgi:hypothetical protein